MNTKTLTFILTILSLFTIFIPRVSAAQRRVYIANDDHTDYMWSANEATYRSAIVQMLDYYLDQANLTAGNQSEYQSRFSADGSFWMWLYQQDRPARFNELINRIKDGHINVPLNSLVTVYGGQPAEAVIRGMYYPGKIERQYNIALPIAQAMENQTMPYGLGALWAGSGAKYTWKGICNCATSLTGFENRAYQMYWWMGPDNSKILTKWYSYLGGNQGIGGYAEARRPAEAVDFLLNNPTFRASYPYNVSAAFGKGWDDLKTLTNEFVTTAQTKTQQYPDTQVYVSNEVDFFKDFETSYGGGLPNQSVTFGNDWDLFTPLIQGVSSQVRRGIEQLRPAEALATLVALKNPEFMSGFSTARDEAYFDLSLFWEHCGTSGNIVGDAARLTWLKKMASTFTNFSNKIYSDSLASLSNMIAKTGTNIRFFVFNPLGWNRSDFVDYAYNGSVPVHAVDLTTGQDVPSQIIQKNSVQYLRILANDIPSVGYKVYEIQSGAGTVFPPGVSVNGSVIENDLYKLTVTGSGAITSLIDKNKNNREFVKNINNKTINDLGGTGGTLTTENSGPVSATLLATSGSPISHTSRITLYKNIDRIDIQNDINQNFTNNQIWSFGFNLSNPDTNHEEIGAVIKAKLTTDGGQYSTKNARYDWLTLNHFADITGSEGFGVTVSNSDLDFFKLGNSTLTSLDTSTPQINILAGGDVGSGSPATGQAGETHFLNRFALKTHGIYSQTEAMKSSLEYQNALIAGTVNGGNQYPADRYSLISTSNPDTLLWAVKPHEDGIASGVVLRFWNQKPVNGSLIVTAPNYNITLAKNITHIETDISNVNFSGQSLTDTIAGNQIKSYRILLSQNSSGTTPSPGQKQGDTDGDGDVDYSDFSNLKSDFNTGSVRSDFNFSGLVDIFDYNVLVANFGQ